MAQKTSDSIKLGLFVISGLLILVFALYMIGQNRSVFGSAFTLKSRFTNVNGLMQGNNVRFSGIQCGTVKSINIINDTTIEITMQISDEISKYVRLNAYTEIGSEGLMGNKVVNIFPESTPAQQVQNGDMLQSRSSKSINDMLGTLSATNDNAADLSGNLREAAYKLNNSTPLWQLLNDTTLPLNIKESLLHIRNAAHRIEHAALSIDEMIADVRAGKGVAGVLLSDENAGQNISDAILHLQAASLKADKLVTNMDSLITNIGYDVTNGKGTVAALLKDTQIVKKLNNSMDNIERGTEAFNEDMEALKHNFLLRGYFRKKEQQRNKDERSKQ